MQKHKAGSHVGSNPNTALRCTANEIPAPATGITGHNEIKNHFLGAGTRLDAGTIFQCPRLRVGKRQEQSGRKAGSHKVALVKKPGAAGCEGGPFIPPY